LKQKALARMEAASFYGEAQRSRKRYSEQPEIAPDKKIWRKTFKKLLNLNIQNHRKHELCFDRNAAFECRMNVWEVDEARFEDAVDGFVVV